MKKGIKRSFALLLTLVMLISTVPVFGEEVSVGEKIFNTLNGKLQLLKPDENQAAVNLVKLLGVALILNDSTDLHNAIDTVLDSNTTLANSLQDYGINKAKMKEIMSNIYAIVPTSSEQMNDKLLGKIYNADGYTVDIRENIKSYVNTSLWNVFPSELKIEIGKFNKSGGTLDTLEEIINVLVSGNVGAKSYDITTSRYSGNKLAISSEVKGNLITALDAINSGSGNSTKLAETFINMGNVILEASENVLISGNKQNDAYKLMDLTGYLTVTNFSSGSDDDDDDDRPSSGGSSGGSSTPSTGTDTDTSTDTGDLDGETKEAADDANDVIDSVEGEASESDQENIQDAVNDVVEKAAENIKTAENAQAVTKALNETTAKAITKLSAPKAVEVAVKQASLVKDALKNKTVTAAQAKEMAQDFVKTVVKSTTDVANVSADQVKQVKAQAATIVKQAVKKAATVKVETKTETSADGKKIATVAVKSDDVKNIITEAKKAVTEMKQTLTENNMSDVAREIKPQITLTVEEEADDVSLDIDSESISQIADAEVDLSVEAKGVTFAVPSGLVKAASRLMSVANKEVTSEDNAKLNNKTGNGIARPLKTFDLSVSVDSSTDGTKNAVKIEIPIESLNLGENPDLDNIMIGVFEDEAWDKITYKVEDGNIVFTAPHFSIYSVMAYVPSFTDVRDHWANKYIASLSAKDIVSGRDEETFDPQGVITRAEFTKILVNMLGLEKEVKTNFYDVEKDKWYYDAVGIAASYGLSAGSKAGNFYPEEAITREDMATMIARAYEIENGFKLEGDVITFADNNDIADYAVEAVKSMKKAEIINGYEDNTFKPKATATRAEAATMIYKLLQK